MRPTIAEAARSEAPHPAPKRRRAWLPRAPRLGVGSRLGLGLAAVAAVLVVGEILATRTAREALQAVRSMQHEHEPLASRASAVLVRLVDYDRAVGEYVQARSAADFATITTAGAALEDAVGNYFDGTPPPPLTKAALELRAQLTGHIANARLFASRAAQRAQWAEDRRIALAEVYQRIATAGGSGLAINGTQVVAQRSLAELQTAIDGIRGNEGSAALARRERDFLAVLDAHAAELQSSPGRAWLLLLRQDFEEAVRLRLAIARYDEVSGGEWHKLLEESAALTAGVQELLQKPARGGLLQAAQHAATAAEVAERTLAFSGAAVLGLLLLVSVLLTLSISLPVRRLTAATRLLSGGDRAARAPRGGSAEIDQLAESFNTMADRIARPRGSCVLTRPSSSGTSTSARGRCITWRITIRSRSCQTGGSCRRGSARRCRAPARVSSSRCCSWTSTTSSRSTTRSDTASATACCSTSPTACTPLPAASGCSRGWGAMSSRCCSRM